FEALSCRLLKGSETKASVTVSSPNVIEIKLDRLIDDMRLLRSQMIAFDKRLKGIEAYLKPSEQQPESKSRPWFAAAASATARTVLILFAVVTATGAALLYLGTWPRQRDCDLRVNEDTPQLRHNRAKYQPARKRRIPGWPETKAPPKRGRYKASDSL